MNVSYYDRWHQRKNNLCEIMHSSAGRQCRVPQGWEQRNGDDGDCCGRGDYLEINLEYPRLITHIGTAGD